MNKPLDYQLDTLENLQKNIENLSFREIREIIERSRSYLSALRLEQQRNLYTVNELRLEIYNHNQSLQSLKTDEERLAALKQSDVELLTYLLTRDAKNENERSFLIGIVVSFPLGVVSSLLASYIFSLQTRRKHYLLTTSDKEK